MKQIVVHTDLVSLGLLVSSDKSKAKDLIFENGFGHIKVLFGGNLVKIIGIVQVQMCLGMKVWWQ